MARPRDRDDDEADQEGRERRSDLPKGIPERLTPGQVRNVDLQHEEGDDDREDTVAQARTRDGSCARS
jgi:hypothetical protein